MSAIDTENFGRVYEHFVGDLPVFGGAALALDVREGAVPKTAEQIEDLRVHAGLLSGRVVTQAELGNSD